MPRVSCCSAGEDQNKLRNDLRRHTDRAGWLGAGDPNLSAIILANLLQPLGERKDKPEYLILRNECLRIAITGRSWIEHLKRLEEQSVRIISCRTCIEFLYPEGQIAVGKIGNMSGVQEIIFMRHALIVWTSEGTGREFRGIRGLKED